MVAPSSIKCLDDSTLLKLAAGECTADELQNCEEHVAECVRCRDWLDSRTIDANWTEEFLPAFHAVDNCENFPQDVRHAFSENRVHESVLNLLGPTDDPHMLGRIGNYEVVALVGVGGMAVVFRAYDGALDRFVAIKMMQPHLALSGAARGRFEREGRAAAAVICDFVLPIYAVSEWRGIPYLVMQYSAGMNLQKRLSLDGPLQLAQTLRIAMQTARGLAAAHAQGLVHRDVKPSNIMLDGTVERAMLTDFGLARAVDDASVTRTGLIAGTPLYMSPEQVLGDKVDAPSDLFSLGCTMYAMCTGHPPFRAEASYAILRRIVDDKPRSVREVNPDVPEWLEQVIMKLLAKSPAERFASAEQLAELLEACLAHVQQPTVYPLPPALAKSAGRNTRKPPVVRLVLAACFFFCMLAGIVIVLDSPSGTLTIECADDNVPIRVMQGEKVVKQMMLSREGKSTRIAAGNYTIEIDQPFDKAYVAEGVAIISRGGREVVKIKRSENESHTVVCYNVEYLLDKNAKAPLEKQLESLADLVRNTIKPESWKSQDCSIATYAANRSLVVKQTRATHKAIADMLQELEKWAMTNVAADDQPKPSSSDEQDQVSIIRDSETGLIQIRGKSQEQVRRVSEVIEKIQRGASDRSGPPSETTSPATPYRALLDAIDVFRDCLHAKSPAQLEGSSPNQVAIELTSITNVVRRETDAGLVVYEFDVDGPTFVNEIAALAFGEKGIADEVLNGFLHDPQGPQIDVRKTVSQAFRKRVKLTCNYRKDGLLAYLAEIELIDKPSFVPCFQRIFEFESSCFANAAKDFYVLSHRLTLTDGRASVGGRRWPAINCCSVRWIWWKPSDMR